MTRETTTRVHRIATREIQRNHFSHFYPSGRILRYNSFRSIHIPNVKIMSTSVFRILLLLVSLTVQASGAPPRFAKPNCSEKCGDVTVPFPFGIGPGCYMDDWYEIECRPNGTVILKKAGLQVLKISLPGLHRDVNRIMDGMINVALPVNYTNASCGFGIHGVPVNLEGSQFVFSQTENVFISSGKVRLTVNCSKSAVGGNSTCAGTNSTIITRDCAERDKYCQIPLPFDLQAFEVEFTEEGGQPECNHAFLAERSWSLRSDVTGFNHWRRTVPGVLEWRIDYNNSYLRDLKSHGTDDFSYYDTFCPISFSSGGTLIMQCYCERGYEGNPYLIRGCQDIDECGDPQICNGTCVNKPGTFDCFDGRTTVTFIFIGVGPSLGALLLGLFIWWLYKYIKKRKEIKLKERTFKRNGGLLLERELSSPEGNVEKSKLFNSKELEKATDNFNDDRILGQGGQGTVYKGMLTDGKIVAIKKSKVIDEGKVEQFINEVLILSQINHRNVVKLLGCCLETEVPLLVYEFIPNGTLYQYLHNPNEEFVISWDTRLRIATETAGALFYLHSAASIPIYHRDIKSTNILLDEKYRAKVADFGTSKYISIDQTHVTTLVQGTFGYLDPEYFQSSQFTDKSDVYSFGVVLVELLTGEKPISSLREQEERSLATYFIISMEENRLFDIVHAQVLKEGKKEDIASVANLAKRCLNWNRRNRPTMKEVAMELEGIRKLQNPLGIHQNQGNREPTEFHGATFTSSKSNIDMDVIAFSDAQPLLPTW